MSRLETSLPIVTATGSPPSPKTRPSSGSGTILLEPRVAAALVRHAGAPDLRRLDRRKQRELVERDGRRDRSLAADRRERVVVIEEVDRLAVHTPDTGDAVELGADEADQYVARPPEMS